MIYEVITALQGQTFSGDITFIDPTIDPTTRVAKVRVEVNNTNAQLKPEMFATGMVKALLNQYQNKVVIPNTAVLWTGKRSLVYVKQHGEEAIFNMREIILGPQLGSSYVVESGLNEGVITSYSIHYTKLYE